MCITAFFSAMAAGLPRDEMPTAGELQFRRARDARGVDHVARLCRGCGHGRDGRVAWGRCLVAGDRSGD